MQGYGAISVADGSTAQTLATSQAALTAWNTSAGSNLVGGFDRDGNIAVKPDKANNRILLAAGAMYRFSLSLSGVADAAADITVQIAKNATGISGTKFTQRFFTTESSLHFSGFFEIKASDNPGTIAAFAEPATGYASPPKVMVPVTVLVAAGTGTPAITIKQACLLVEKYE